VWTADRARGERIAADLESGMVWINDHMFSHGACQCAWGGVKDSGLGRTHSKFGLYECVNVKQLAVIAEGLLEFETLSGDEIKGLLNGITPDRSGIDPNKPRALSTGGSSIPKTKRPGIGGAAAAGA